MPLITEEVPIQMVCGFECDRCHRVEQGIDADGAPNPLTYFELDHTFGYGTPLDTIGVRAVVCDRCLAEIVISTIPGARFAYSNGFGDPLDHADIQQII